MIRGVGCPSLETFLLAQQFKWTGEQGSVAALFARLFAPDADAIFSEVLVAKGLVAERAFFVAWAMVAAQMVGQTSLTHMCASRVYSAIVRSKAI